MFREQMKTKSFLVLLLCIILTSTVVYLLGNETPHFAHQLVSETQRKIVSIDFKKLNTEIKSRHQLSAANQKLLSKLGFVDSPRLYPKDVPRNVTPPVMVTSVTSAQYNDALDFVRSVHLYFPHTVIVMYGVDLSRSQNKWLSEKCNCTFRIFNFEIYPSHVGSLDSHAYRPLIFQECLNDFGAIIYLDVSVRVVSRNVSRLLRRAERVGVQAWYRHRDATTSFTHPKMFDFFGTKISAFHYHQMFDGDNIIVYNTPAVHRLLMLPLIQCCLTDNCISPIGSQRSGCALRKPFYLYRGCHRYDVSALNVVLGLMFNYTSAPYDATGYEFFVTSQPQATDVRDMEAGGAGSRNMNGNNNNDRMGSHRWEYGVMQQGAWRRKYEGAKKSLPHFRLSSDYRR